MSKTERKPEPKYKVTQLMTEGQIQGIGGNLWIAKQAKRILAFMVVVLIVGIGIANTSYNVRLCYIAAIGAITIAGLFFMLKAGKRFFDSLDKTQPIDLTEKTK
jgi:hypothetical protein